MSTPEEAKQRREAALASLQKRLENLKPELKPDDLVTVIRGPHKDMKGRIIGIHENYIKYSPVQMLYNVLSMDEKTQAWFPAEKLELLERQDHARMNASSLMANNPYLVNL